MKLSPSVLEHLLLAAIVILIFVLALLLFPVIGFIDFVEWVHHHIFIYQ